MKKILFLLIALAFFFGAFAQEKQIQAEPYLMLQQGKMWVMKEGKTQPMEADQTLGNGTMVTMSGKVTTKDGIITMLEEGDAINMSGIITKTNTKSTDKKEKRK